MDVGALVGEPFLLKKVEGLWIMKWVLEVKLVFLWAHRRSPRPLRLLAIPAVALTSTMWLAGSHSHSFQELAQRTGFSGSDIALVLECEYHYGAVYCMSNLVSSYKWCYREARNML